MRVAVSASAATLDAQVDPRFGRCPWFMIVDPATMAFEAIENDSSAAAQGAGIATAQMVSGQAVEAVLTGNCGPNAYQALAAAGIVVVTGVGGRVMDAALAYAAGELKTSTQPNVASHHGMAVGGGRGMGGGSPRASAQTPASSPTDHGGAAMADLLLELKGQLDALREQVSDINRRIEELHSDD